MKKAVFLDRDGTIIEDVVYLNNPDSLVVFKGVHEALEKLKNSGYILIVVTNQSAINRGLLNHKTLDLIHEELNMKLDYLIDYFLYCPHTPFDQCLCRKPQSYMLHQAKEMFDIDLTQSWIIGDSEEDMQCGKDANCKTVGVLTGLRKDFIHADYIASNIKSAVNYICKQ